MALMAASKVRKGGAAMAPNAFAGQPNQPTETALATALGKTNALWHNLVADLRQELGLDGEEWHSYSVKAGWSLRLQLKKRNIVYLGPRDGWFLAAFALGDRAVAAAKQSKLPAAVLKMIAEAKRYVEGTAVRIEVKEPSDVAVVKTLARIKVEN